MAKLANPPGRNANRLPYVATWTEAGTWYVYGPTPNEPHHTWPFMPKEDAEALADSLNSAWQVGRRTGAQDRATTTYQQ